MYHDMYRGTGRTTRALKEAVTYAIQHPKVRVLYVLFHHAEIPRTKMLLDNICAELKIPHPTNLELRSSENLEAVRGLEAKVLLDHHAVKSMPHEAYIQWHEYRRMADGRLPKA